MLLRVFSSDVSPSKLQLILSGMVYLEQSTSVNGEVQPQRQDTDRSVQPRGQTCLPTRQQCTNTVSLCLALELTDLQLDRDLFIAVHRHS